MNLTTIRDISRELGISTRTLRYYEQIGLIESVKKEDYAYRAYDDTAVTRLQQILVLRKLRIPLKQIAVILHGENTAEIIQAFQQNLAQVDDEITALSTIRNIIDSFLTRLTEGLQNTDRSCLDSKLNLLDDTALLEAVDALTVEKTPLKEKTTTAALELANEQLNRLTDKDVRIVYLPPATVASCHIMGYEPERDTARIIDQFTLEKDLPTVKPDFRSYGFNCPNPVDETNYHGYEMWVTIPEDMEVPAPLVKKHFPGGLYAAHMIWVGAFEEWGWLWDWANNNNRYQANLVDDGGACMNGLLEEHLNYRNNVSRFADGEWDGFQLDLLLPISEKTNK